MKTVLQRFFSSLSLGSLLVIFLYAIGFPLALAAHYTHTCELYRWLSLMPGEIWRGEAWRTLTYAFLPAGVVDWVVSLFWLVTLISVLGRNWSARELWTYCLLTTFASALVITLGNPSVPVAVVGNGAMIFGLLAAWYRLYGRERLVLLGIGEMSVRQAAVIVGIVETLILFFSLGWFITLCMLGGGVAGWVYLWLRGLHALNRRSQVIDSQRIARLEL
jgi:membrane associated rhomboid family serine protease